MNYAHGTIFHLKGSEENENASLAVNEETVWRNCSPDSMILPIEAQQWVEKFDSGVHMRVEPFHFELECSC